MNQSEYCDSNYQLVENTYVEYAKGIIIERIYSEINKNNVSDEPIVSGYHENLSLGELCECLHLLEIKTHGFRMD